MADFVPKHTVSAVLTGDGAAALELAALPTSGVAAVIAPFYVGPSWPATGVQAASEAARDAALAAAADALTSQNAAATSAGAFASSLAALATSLINTQTIVVNHHGYV